MENRSHSLRCPTNQRGTTSTLLDGVAMSPSDFGLTKPAYSVNETLSLLPIGRTSLYEAIKDGKLHPRKHGKKTIILAPDLAAFLTQLEAA
jgi:hypothetical protein